MAYILENVKILVVDDMKPMLSLASSVLKIFGFKNIFVAANADEGFGLLSKHDPDIVLTDWMMEPMDGLEFTKMIRRNPMSPNPYVPVIMMTGFSSKLRVEAARDIGITEFLVKPFSSRDLYTRISQIVEKPRQFVDTGQFFGPDRRRKMSVEYEGPRRRDADVMEIDLVESAESQDKIADIIKKLRHEAGNM